MKRYDRLDLSDPATYAADPELAELARATANFNFFAVAKGQMSMADFRQRVGAGQYPELMVIAVNDVVDRALALEKTLAAAREAAAALVPPVGYSITLESEHLLVSGPWSDDLHTRIKRLGGAWDGQCGQNRRLWVVPLEKAVSLQRVFGNSSKAVEKAAAEKAAAKRADEARREQQRALRERDLLVIKEESRQRREAEREERARRVQQRALFPCADAPALQRPIRWRGQPVVFESTGERFRITENHPSTHGGHLLGHEGDWGRYYYYRPATDAEAAALERADAAEHARVAADAARKARLVALRERIKTEGERPAGSHQPDGERIADTQDHHGGGEWFILGVEWIWYCQNNGADGDDWSLNNIVTGGAGAIGWRVPRAAELAEELAHVRCPTP